MLNKPIKSEFILVQQNEKDLKIENGTEKVLDELKEANSSSITLRDFCNSNLLNQFIFEVAIFFLKKMIFPFLMAVTPHAKRSLFISFTMITLAYLSGTVTILNYIQGIFKETGSVLSTQHSSILVTVR